MKVIDLLKIVESAAQEYRPGSLKSIQRNSHLHDCADDDIGKQDFVDAVLTDFINFLAARYGVDYAMHASDIYWPESLDEFKRIDALRYSNLVQAEREMEQWEQTKEEKRRNEI